MSDKEKNMSSKEKELFPKIIERILELDDKKLIYLNGFVDGLGAQTYAEGRTEKEQ